MARSLKPRYVNGRITLNFVSFCAFLVSVPRSLFLWFIDRGLQAWHVVQSFKTSLFRPETININTYGVTCEEIYASVHETVPADANWLYIVQLATNDAPIVVGEP